jgi:phosphoribosylformimino-5-aminoimidazole carboxamide ribotide isomerase
MIVFPAIDILNSWCVRLHQGKYDAVTVYAKDPSEIAKAWQAGGAEWIHVVDLDGAKEGRPINLAAVEKIAAKVDIPIQFGGGVRTQADIARLFDVGVSRIVLGTVLVTDTAFAEQAIKAYGDKLVAGIDGREGKVAIAGWREDTDVDIVELAAELAEKGVKRVIYTDINVDGTRKGPNIAATKYLAESVDVPVIASGGVSTLGDIIALTNISPAIEGVIVGSALYEKVFGLTEALEVAKG